MDNTAFRRLLYSLRRRWGVTVDYVRVVTSQVDERTGTREIERDVLSVPALLLPQNQTRKFIQDIGYLAANKNFTYGGLNDFNTVTLIVEASHLKVQPDLNGYIVLKGRRYERVSFDNLFDFAFSIVAKGVEGSLPYTTLRKGVCSKFLLQQRVSYELN